MRLPLEHDSLHFKPDDKKPKQGVWRGDLKKVRQWVMMALDSIYDNDGFVVDSKPGKDPGDHIYLVSMDGEEVGYLSGYLVPAGEKPPAKHIHVILNKRGATVAAFPSDPSMF
jgi:hypothetical protein